ncbi:hypothetical protein SARC_07856 [Sphaeroforma arctica JP610]|uniref:RGS domain-containing protein n=1 Tax=Sphaeroforma arctica JP610 TaxID=667725 RepID=A0A0L0FT64_9EUKA|nr:hypothetical protein SARC_07856 [Sphaeroforma arctica JP610]KNC79756.1 hypothetical protein SARC_07856 [Sphaeroforma arctica JP610]|eukprot:XP_014153658.1 hypothetical protein SARC_07856 [Sphaeroforma arctica JP610]
MSAPTRSEIIPSDVRVDCDVEIPITMCEPITTSNKREALDKKNPNDMSAFCTGQNHCSTLPVADVDRPDIVARVANITAIVVCVFIFALAAVLFWRCESTPGTLNDGEIVYGDEIFRYMLIMQIPTIVLLVALLLFFIVFWNEPEVCSRHHAFIAHFWAAAFSGCVFTIAWAAVMLQVTSLEALNEDGSYKSTFTEIVLWLFICEWFCEAMMLSAVVSRMYFMHVVFNNGSSAQPKYWLSVAIHTAIFIVSMTPQLVCYYGQKDCSVLEFRIGNLFYEAVLCGRYFYYLAFTNVSSFQYFLDFKTNIRVFAAFFVFYWSTMIYSCATNSYDTISYFRLFIHPCLVWLFTLDNFLLVVLRVLSRRFGKSTLLQNYDLLGQYYEELQYGKCVGCLLFNHETRDILLSYAGSRHCAEAVEFEICIAECKQLEKQSVQEARDMARDCTEIFVRVNSSKEINIKRTVRNRIIDLVNKDSYKDIDDLFYQASFEILNQISQNLLSGFYQTPEFIAFQQECDNRSKLTEALRVNGLIVVDNVPDSMVALTVEARPSNEQADTGSNRKEKGISNVDIGTGQSLEIPNNS